MASAEKKAKSLNLPEHSPAPSPERAIYGFVLYLLTYVGFGFYLFWALLPDEWLHAIGITYLPHRVWIFLGPCLFVLIVVFVILLFLLNNYMNTPDLDSLSFITDSHQNISPLSPEELAPLADLSISDVNRMVYLRKKIQ